MHFFHLRASYRSESFLTCEQKWIVYLFIDEILLQLLLKILHTPAVSYFAIRVSRMFKKISGFRNKIEERKKNNSEVKLKYFCDESHNIGWLQFLTQICSLTRWPSIKTVRILKSTPIVVM